eukprot:450258_1
MNMPSLYHFVVLYIFRLVLVSSTAFCYEPYQCTNETVTDNFTVHAYKGAYGAQTSLIGYGDCNGAHSCQLVQLIQTEYFKLWCSGAYSCSNTTILIINGDIWCSAVHSCSFTHFLGGDPDLTFVWTDLRCEGYFSCAYALIEDIPVVYAGGSYALYKAVIDTTRAQNLAGNFRFYFYGEYSGYGAKIICAHPGYQHCTIHCYSTGCHMLFLDCIADCTIYTYPSATAILPLHIANISQYVRPNHSLFEVNNDENCAIYNTTFDSYQERNQGADIVSDTPICCRGDESCSNVNLITTKANVICSGSYACAYSLIDMRTSNGSVFCEADNSCRSSQIDGAADLHCMAGASCDSSMISNIDRVLCAADYSCENATIVSSGRDLNVYFGGYKSGNATKIYCDANDSCLIVCAAYFACYQTMFICERNANCTVQCDPQTPDYCPLIRNINTTTEHPSQTMLNTSTTPTEYPSQATNIPSIFPTDHPLQTTVAPTYIPKTTTTAPTEDPLQSIPSASPTNHALQTTFHPSLNPLDIFSKPTQPRMLAIVFGICNLTNEELKTESVIQSKRMLQTVFASIFNVSLNQINVSVEIGSFCSKERTNRRQLLQQGKDEEVRVQIIFSEADDVEAAEQVACDEAEAIVEKNKQIFGYCIVESRGDVPPIDGDSDIPDADLPPGAMTGVVVTVVVLILISVAWFAYASRHANKVEIKLSDTICTKAAGNDRFRGSVDRNVPNNSNPNSNPMPEPTLDIDLNLSIPVPSVRVPVEEHKSEREMIAEVLNAGKAHNIKTEDLCIEEEVGGGRFGTVFRAMWSVNTVAVKQLHSDGNGSRAQDLEMKAEIILASSLPTHQNVVEIFGYTQSPFGVVMRFMSDSVEQ